MCSQTVVVAKFPPFLLCRHHWGIPLILLQASISHVSGLSPEQLQYHQLSYFFYQHAIFGKQEDLGKCLLSTSSRSNLLSSEQVQTDGVNYLIGGMDRMVLWMMLYPAIDDLDKGRPHHQDQ